MLFTSFHGVNNKDKRVKMDRRINCGAAAARLYDGGVGRGTVHFGTLWTSLKS